MIQRCSTAHSPSVRFSAKKRAKLTDVTMLRLANELALEHTFQVTKVIAKGPNGNMTAQVLATPKSGGPAKAYEYQRIYVPRGLANGGKGLDIPQFYTSQAGFMGGSNPDYNDIRILRNKEGATLVLGGHIGYESPKQEYFSQGHSGDVADAKEKLASLFNQLNTQIKTQAEDARKQKEHARTHCQSGVNF
jgi:hypothetical protein